MTPDQQIKAIRDALPELVTIPEGKAYRFSDLESFSEVCTPSAITALLARLDAAEADAKQLIQVLQNCVAVAVVMLFYTHPKDVWKEFSIQELNEISLKSESLNSFDVEKIYRTGFDAARAQETK